MAEPRLADPALLVVAAFSRHDEALDWAATRLSTLFGPRAPLTFSFDFTQTRYYEATMGTKLRKHLLIFENLVDPARLAAIKLQTNALEAELARSGGHPEPRPLNLDPGLLTLGKFSLATTKDQAHRVYLRDGIFAEVTLRYHAGAFEPCDWTYADYRQPAVLEFLVAARDYYRGILGRKGEL